MSNEVNKSESESILCFESCVTATNHYKFFLKENEKVLQAINDFTSRLKENKIDHSSATSFFESIHKSFSDLERCFTAMDKEYKNAGQKLIDVSSSIGNNTKEEDLELAELLKKQSDAIVEQINDMELRNKRLQWMLEKDFDDLGV